MSIRKARYIDGDFTRIRDFFVYSYKNLYRHHNWLIDRWNFCRYVAQSFHGTFESWPETIGIWETDGKDIVAIVNSEGEDRGEAFFQVGMHAILDDIYSEMLNHAETSLYSERDSEKYINLRVDAEDARLKEFLKNRNYHAQDWKEPTSSMPIDGLFPLMIPDGFHIADAESTSPYQIGFAHGRAFGYYNNETPDDEDAQKAFTSIRKAPDYNPKLDVSILDENGDVASFATIWHDTANRIGILEPVGTIPKYRGMGLGKAAIGEGINRVRELGADKIYVGADSGFYRSIGFSVEYEKEIWQKKW